MDEVTIICPVADEINSYCSCPKAECPRHGLCCQCIFSHKGRIEEPLIKRLPHCLGEMVAEGMNGQK